MLEHQKIVLQNVYYNKNLFKKELHKSIDWLSQEELNELWDWLKENYWETHSELILESFTFTAKAY
jgi:hypothetical protein